MRLTDGDAHEARPFDLRRGDIERSSGVDRAGQRVGRRVAFDVAKAHECERDGDDALQGLWAGAEALSHGRGGIAAVARASGMSERTVSRGRREAAAGETLAPGQVRARGAGRKALTENDRGLLEALEALVLNEARGDGPDNPEKPAGGAPYLGENVPLCSILSAR